MKSRDRNSPMNPDPLRFLAWFCPASLYESIEGDLLEQWERDKEKIGERKARKRLWLAVLRFFRPGIIFRNTYSIKLVNVRMLRSYFITGMRNIYKRKLASVVNITGISIALTFFILVSLFIQDDYSFDRFHKNVNQIYRVESIKLLNDKVIPESMPTIHPIPLGPALKEEVSGLEFSTRYDERDLTIKGNHRQFVETIDFVDADFLKMFSLEMAHGSGANALDDLFGIAINETESRKLFGDTDPVGKVIEMEGQPFTVRAVFKDLPRNSTLECQLLVRYENFPAFKEQRDDWNSRYSHVFIQRMPGTDPAIIERQLKNVLAHHSGHHEKSRIESILTLRPLSQIHFDLSPGWPKVSNEKYSYILGGLAIVILLVACINYTLLSLAISSKRSIEVGIRKVVGATRQAIRWQFFGETQILIVLSLPLALLFSYLFLPVFNEFTNKNLSLHQFNNSRIGLILLATVFLTGVLAGVYPAFILARSTPQKVLKINSSSKFKTTLGNYLIVFQFASCIALMMVSLVMYMQMRFIQNKDLGFQDDQIVIVDTFNNQNINGRTILSRFRSELGNEKDVKFISAIGSGFGKFGGSTSSIDSTGKESARYFSNVDYDFFELLQAKLVDGRLFSREFHDDSTNNQVINETLAKEIRSKPVIGAPVLGIRGGIVIGVVKDFNFQPLDKEIVPMAFGFGKTYFRKIFIKINSSNIPQSLEEIEKAWKKAVGDEKFSYTFLDEDIDAQYKQYYKWLKTISYGAGLGILIACLGLFGLTGLLIVNRTKEIGIRKVLGATVLNILTLLSKAYVTLAVVAFVIASPVAWYFMKEWLGGFAYRIDLNYWIFIFPGLTMVGMTLIIVMAQSLRSARMNPTESLRYE